MARERIRGENRILNVRSTIPLCLLAASAFANGSDDKGIKAVRVAIPPIIDGRIDEAEWKDVPFVEGLHDSETGAAYVETGRFWLAYDRDYVYFAARLKAANPRAIRATEYRTNVALTGDDFIELDLDLSGSMSAFNRFQINPRGATNIQIAGGRAAKREWLGEFQAKGRVVADGWEAEARIPWRAMDVPRGGRRNIRFNVLRFVAENQRSYTYVYVPMTENGLTPVWAGVELPRPEVDRSIRLLPYGYAGHDPHSGGVFNAGLDVKTALADQVTLVGSINPDFRNIENQILSLDFSRFERLAGETRPFFQEGQQYSNSQIFASQRIRGFDVGLNSYGRLSDQMSFAVIGAVGAGRERDLVVNLTEDPNPTTSIRVSGTDLERSDLSNQVILARVSQNAGPWNLTIRNMTSRDSALGVGAENDLFINYLQGSLGLSANWTRADKGFAPRLGYVQEVDYDGPTLSVGYGRNYPRGGLQDWSLFAFGLSYDHADASFYRKEFGGVLTTTVRPGVSLTAGWDVGDFEGSKDSLYTLGAAYPKGNPRSNVAMQMDVGKQAGTPYRSLTGSALYRPLKNLQLSARHQHLEYGGALDQTVLSASFDMGRDRTLAGRLVRQGSKLNAYLAYQRSGNAGVEYFLILGDPNAPTFRSSLILKVAVPLQLGGRTHRAGG